MCLFHAIALLLQLAAPRRFAARIQVRRQRCVESSRNCRALTRRVVLLAWLAACGLPGCVAVPVTASNPIPGLTTVAVAPFFNLSAEASLDDRRFALAYFTELQKMPGFQVVPVGVVERAIEENQLSMSRPADAIKLAEILNVDAVVVGAVTDYSPYYPPQVGLHIHWYSPRDWMFYPGIPGGECLPGTGGATPCANGPMAPQPVLRGQSDGAGDEQENYNPGPFRSSPPQIAQSTKPGAQQGPSAPKSGPWSATPRTTIGRPQKQARMVSQLKPTQFFQNGADPQENVLQPLMSYTRFFDGADPRLMSSLRDYYAYRGDLRSGGWEAYLHRSDDFIQFVTHMTIVEMLSLHGGVLQTEYILKRWK